ncbi:carboxypeptidase-like regulatory domain-containing protein [Hymenobacter sediminis]|uniref:carboxypeptidase-like regulatory domain-containing protein n=1 Tax=Hymenobacter sediminis TaxID=2218621 RepID=UPI000DA65F5D|nr:carboxypeptidase-like regulatory domain-containing protein [Hymenobacter sediminis]RPD47067.1 carboxypeptidase-like regulatory domain-containing protein [Hymenobacter sediminis]
MIGRSGFLPVFWIFLLGLLLVAGSSMAQIRVTGSISDASTRKPVPGASVVVQRTRQGVVANQEGDFNISANSTDTLIFRAVGFKAQRMPLGGSGLSQLIVHIKLQQDTVMLGEVRVTEGRPDRATINKALRNIKRPSTAPTSYVKRPPAPKPMFPVDSAAPKAPTPTLASPVSLIYEQFSRAGKERRKMEEIQAAEAAQKAAEQARKARTQYNKNFKDNRGYE